MAAIGQTRRDDLEGGAALAPSTDKASPRPLLSSTSSRSNQRRLAPLENAPTVSPRSVTPEEAATRVQAALRGAKVRGAIREHGWASVRRVVREDVGLLSRRNDTLPGAGKRCMAWSVVLAVWVLLGGLGYQSLERETELRAAAEYARWTDLVEQMSRDGRIPPRLRRTTAAMLESANPNQAEVNAKHREDAAQDKDSEGLACLLEETFDCEDLMLFDDDWDDDWGHYYYWGDDSGNDDAASSSAVGQTGDDSTGSHSLYGSDGAYGSGSSYADDGETAGSDNGGDDSRRRLGQAGALPNNHDSSTREAAQLRHGRGLASTVTILPALPDWDFLGSLFFSFTLVTTIGYGSSAPTTMESKIFLMFYVLFGIACAGFLLDTMGRLLLVGVSEVHSRCSKHPLDARRESMLLLGLVGALVVVMGIAVSELEWGERGTEPWNWWEGVYWAFITLSTVGLGDYAPSTKYSRVLTGICCCIGLGLLASLVSSVAAAASDYSKMLERLKAARRTAAARAEAARIKASARAGAVLSASRKVIHTTVGDTPLPQLPEHHFSMTDFLRYLCCKRKPGHADEAAIAPLESVVEAGGEHADDEGLGASKRADARWDIVAASARVSMKKTRRGDTLQSLLPRAIFAFGAFLLLLVLGAVVFEALERQPELLRLAKYDAMQSAVQNVTAREVDDESTAMLADMLVMAHPSSSVRASALRERMGRNSPISKEELEAADPEGVDQWDFLGSTFFAMTILTTVGYGSYSTATLGGQFFSLCFGFIGIGIVALALDSVSRLYLVLATKLAAAATRRPITTKGEIGVGLLVAVVLNLIGAAVFTELQAGSEVEWSYVESLYFVVVTVTSVGLGDMVPTTEAGLVFVVVYMYLVMGIVAFVLAALGDYLSKINERVQKKGTDVAKMASHGAVAGAQMGLSAGFAATKRGLHVAASTARTAGEGAVHVSKMGIAAGKATSRRVTPAPGDATTKQRRPTLEAVVG